METSGMTWVAIYFLIGFLACLADSRASARKNKQAASLFGLADPLLIVVWPILFVISAIERSRPPEPKESPAPPESPIPRLKQSGTVVVELRPSGKIQIGDEVLGARADEHIGLGEKVVVIGSELGELVVRKAKA